MNYFSRLREKRSYRIQWHRFWYYWYFVKSYYYGKDRFNEKAAVQKQLWQQWEQMPQEVEVAKPVATTEEEAPPTTETRYQPFVEKLKNRLALITGKARA
ncbi:hypothetical protein [Alteribacter aurantiacus]|uniref:hypothetical protein n=1 Tax=Alteribacter aurantiacus TaxID=254410 RepID=UPI00041ABBD7|nr:hypothetical protein [Alteribacter aurantiacus]